MPTYRFFDTLSKVYLLIFAELQILSVITVFCCGQPREKEPEYPRLPHDGRVELKSMPVTVLKAVTGFLLFALSTGSSEVLWCDAGHLFKEPRKIMNTLELQFLGYFCEGFSRIENTVFRCLELL